MEFIWLFYLKMDLLWNILLVLFFSKFQQIDSSKFCVKNPKAVQCVALKNQFQLPKHSSCNPFTKSSTCRIGDLVSTSVARCERKLTGNIKVSLLNGYKESAFQRCFPGLKTPDDLRKRNVAFARGQPGCKPVVFNKKSTLTCGEMGTRCVCDGPAGVTKWLKNECRCQWFVNLCQIPHLCAHRNAKCQTSGSQVQCRCPPKEKNCRPGINHCRGNPTLCENDASICVELYEKNSEWELGNEKEGNGFACVNNSTVQALKRTTYYCDISTPILQFVRLRWPKNNLDVCCYKMFTCAASVSYPQNGNVFSYRACYCFTLFRKCLFELKTSPIFKDKVIALLNVLDKVSHCEMDDGNRCDPTRPWTCWKGDLIKPSLAHCKIDCSTGPLLPIYLRACAIRQCKVPFQDKTVIRIVDVPRSEESSLCKPVKGLAVECGAIGTDTRCVCDGKPAANSGFTDRCRCEFWPDRWDKKYTRAIPTITVVTETSSTKATKTNS